MGTIGLNKCFANNLIVFYKETLFDIQQDKVTSVSLYILQMPLEKSLKCVSAFFFYLTGIRREWLLQLLIVILSALVGVLLMVCVWFVVKKKKTSALYT